MVPAVYPVEYAICKLNPPVYASTSIISPAKNKPFTSFDSIVFGFISFVLIPPDVTIPSSKGLKPEIVMFNFFIIFTSLVLSSFVILFTCLSGSIYDKLIIVLINFCGSKLFRLFLNSLFLNSSKSL